MPRAPRAVVVDQRLRDLSARLLEIDNLLDKMFFAIRYNTREPQYLKEEVADAQSTIKEVRSILK